MRRRIGLGSPTEHLTPIVVAAYCIKPRGALTINQARKRLKQGSRTFAVLRCFAMRFRGIVVPEPRRNWTNGSMMPFILVSPS
ncbi:transposase (plasmid) [Rhizobium grahamii CCGE 502]|uniref:Transposase n=1 Tax=Rhizobium grahamii CCGE 502 TaxID=990285 RepID=S3I1Y5_9HYPH|nr:transposase [Rhizobium grahamii CCGE 502]